VTESDATGRDQDAHLGLADRSASANTWKSGLTLIAGPQRIRESLVASETSIKAALEPVKLIEGIATALPGGRKPT
jgi:hypothetical protein